MDRRALKEMNDALKEMVARFPRRQEREPRPGAEVDKGAAGR
jgi:hypothetical protein